MAHGTARAAATAVLGLIALQAVGTRGGNTRVAQLFGDINGLVDRVLDPTVPAIPDLRNGERWGGGGSKPNSTPATPGRQYGSADAGDHWSPPVFPYGSADAADHYR